MKSGAPNFGIGLVDVRDVAEAHYRGGFTPEAHGRNILRGHNSSFLEMAQILHAEFGDKYPIPNKGVPKWLLMLIGPMVNKAITRQFVRNNINHPWTASNAKVVKELGMTFRPLKDTLVESFQVLIDNDVVKAK